MTKDEALKLALEALTNAYWPTESDLMPAHNIKECADAITAIKEALAQPEQEPVACVEYIPCCTDQTCQKCKAAIKPELVCVCGAVWEGQELIYTTPQHTWVGLTDEEVGEWTPEIHVVIQAIEAKLRSKNT